MWSSGDQQKKRETCNVLPFQGRVHCGLQSDEKLWHVGVKGQDTRHGRWTGTKRNPRKWVKMAAKMARICPIKCPTCFQYLAVQNTCYCSKLVCGGSKPGGPRQSRASLSDGEAAPSDRQWFARIWRWIRAEARPRVSPLSPSSEDQVASTRSRARRACRYQACSRGGADGQGDTGREDLLP